MRFFFFAFYLLTQTAAAQTFKADTAFLTQAKEQAILRYTNQLSGQSYLTNGSRHTRIESSFIPHSNPGNEHPYYSLEWIPGNVLYNGEWYSSTFWYDINKDQLITPNIYQSGQIQLVREKIEQFTLGEHRFVYLKEAQLPEGFYEIIHDGITKAYARFQKKEEVQYRNYKLVSEFTRKTSYYIKKNNTVYEVKSKGSVLKVLAERKSELKKILQTQSKPFNTNREFFIREMVRIYDQSKTTE